MSSVRPLLALLLAMQATVALAVPAGVLCVSSDGHVALEGLEAACCHADSHAADLEVHADTTAADCCGPCVDIEFLDTAPALRAEQHSALLPAGPTTVALLPLRLSSLERPAPPPLPAGPPDAPSLALLTLRTVVLTR